LKDRKRVEKQIKDVQDKSDVLRSEVSYPFLNGNYTELIIAPDYSNSVRSSATSCTTPSCGMIDIGAKLELIIALHGVRS
jgi:hypothetical protein